jgi:hypothetical protein
MLDAMASRLLVEARSKLVASPPRRWARPVFDRSAWRAFAKQKACTGSASLPVGG